MKGIPFEIGRVTVSKQGHDKGRWFVVVGVADAKHVLIADGRRRLLETPKKKQTKHLKWKPHLAEPLVQGKPLQNSDLRKALSAAMAQEPNPKRAAGQALSPQKEECALVQE